MSSEDENEDIVLQFVSENINAEIPNNNNQKSYYSQLKPNFNKTVNWITCQEEVDDFKKKMDGFVSKIKMKYKDTNGTKKKGSNLHI